MRLKELEIYGFKSFPQRTRIGFSEGITGIVGPNGSGKSNIGDAIRWVLGEQSARILRGAKMEDVIFAGTEVLKAMPYCEVSLVFDNESGALPVDYQEVMVTRRAYRDGEGEYYLNKKACRLKDIVDLFRDTGIGKEGYSLIGQGRIDEILSPKGDERRQVFEEAFGVVTYRARKQEAERKLEKTTENLIRVEDLLEDIGQRLPVMEERAHGARRYLNLFERQKFLDINVFLHRHKKLQGRLAQLTELSAQLTQQIEDCGLNLTALTTQRDDIALTLRDKDGDVRTAQTEAEDKANRYYQARADAERDEARRLHLNDNIARIEQELLALQHDLAQLQSLETQDDESIIGEDGSLKKLAEALRVASDSLAALQSEQAALEGALASKQSDLLVLVNQMGDRRSAHARQEAMLLQMQSQKDKLALDAAKSADIAKTLQGDLALAQQALSEADITYQEAKEEKERLSIAQETLVKRALALNSEAASLQADKQAVDSRLRVLRDMQDSYEGYQQAVRKALTFAKGNQKVRGVVADILRVPKELETAIDMILGGSLQHIVTDDEETAKTLIDYLRENRLGRTTFLPISAMRSRGFTSQERQLLARPGCLGAAEDLVEFDSVYAPVVQSLLGRTAVTETLPDAIKLSRQAGQSFHVVTLQGDVMRAGGAMTGGTSFQRSASLLGRPREISELMDRLKSLQTKQASLVKALDDAMAEKAGVDGQLTEVTGRFQQADVVRAREQERVRHAEATQQAHLAQSQELEEAIAQLTETMQDLSDDLAQTESHGETEDHDRALLEAELAELNKKLSAMRDQERLKGDEVHALGISHQERLSHLEGLRRDKMRREKERARLTAAIASRTEQKGALATQLLALDGSGEGDKQGLEDAKTAHQDALARVAKANASRDECAQKQQEILAAIDKAHADHNQAASKFNRNEMVKARTEDELKGMAQYVWDSYELTLQTAQEQAFEGAFDLVASERELTGIKEEIKELGSVNIHAIEDYQQEKQRFDELNRQRDDALKAKEDLNDIITQLLGSMQEKFLEGFYQLNDSFGETFKRLFKGGKAELRLSDPKDALNCAIDIAAQPPGKKLQWLSLLSGGERTLTAIAILFAMLKLKPTPFCVLDEIEAALDEVNIDAFADYLSEYTDKTQFIVVTHRKGTMERCHALYGVSMREKGVSSMISVNMQDYH